MLRVTRGGGSVAACVWDHAGGGTPLATFWRAAHEIAPSARRQVTSGSLAVSVDYRTFEQWWEPYTLGVGPAGAYVASLDDAHRTALADRCRALLPSGPFTVEASAWYAHGTA